MYGNYIVTEAGLMDEAFEYVIGCPSIGIHVDINDEEKLSAL